MKKIFVLIVITFILCGCTKNSDELVMVTEAGFAPYEYYENGEIVGVDVDIAKYIAEKLNKKLVIKDVAFDSLINEVKTKKADFAAAGISYTPERDEEVDFSINYVTSKQVVLVKTDSNIESINNISKEKIAVQLGTIADSYVTKNFKDTEIVRQKKYLSAVEDLKRGKVTVLVMDELPAKEIVKENTELKILPGYLVTDSYGMIVRKGNTELLNSINKCLEELKSSGKIEEYTKLLNKINSTLERLMKEGKIEEYIINHTK